MGAYILKKKKKTPFLMKETNIHTFVLMYNWGNI